MKRFILPGILAAVASCNCPKTAQSAAQETVKQNVAKENWGNPNEVKAQGKFQLSGLAYGYSDLEPYIDGRTMSIHYSKHYLGYTNNLNKAIAGTALESQTIEEILAGLDLNNKAVRNNAGGYYNHTLFWEVMTPKKTTPKGALLAQINADFGSLENFKNQFAEYKAYRRYCQHTHHMYPYRKPYDKRDKYQPPLMVWGIKLPLPFYDEP